MQNVSGLNNQILNSYMMSENIVMCKYLLQLANDGKFPLRRNYFNVLLDLAVINGKIKFLKHFYLDGVLENSKTHLITAFTHK